MKTSSAFFKLDPMTRIDILKGVIFAAVANMKKSYYENDLQDIVGARGKLKNAAYALLESGYRVQYLDDHKCLRVQKCQTTDVVNSLKNLNMSVSELCFEEYSGHVFITK